MIFSIYLLFNLIFDSKLFTTCYQYSSNNFLLLLCLGLSLKTQQLTATFLFARLFCSLQIEGDIHTILDLVTLVATFWLIFMMKYKLKSFYMEDLDNMKKYIVVRTLYLSLPLALFLL